jgi:1-acyl-sn-glycerol-3-phosphate acyltransferase
MAMSIMYGFIYLLLRALVRIGVLRWRVEGRENLPPRQLGGMILITNHIHWVDIPVIGAMLPFSHRLSWLAKIELFENPILGWWFRIMQVIPIKRGRRDLAALEAAETALKGGAVLLIFPEGHRSRDGNLQQGRGGAVRLAMRTGSPIIPAAIIGTEGGLKGVLSGMRVTMRIGKPYIVDSTPDGKVPPDQMEQLTTDMMRRIAVMLPPDQRGPYADALPQKQSLQA